MKELHTEEIINAIEKLCIDTCMYPDEDVKGILCSYAANETSEMAKDILSQLVENIETAKKNRIPSCQDTGLAVMFLEIGQDLHILGDDLNDAINEGIRRGYKKGYFRNSVVHPLTRLNTNDNTPCVIHTEICKGENLTVNFMPKGFGSENMSRLKMLTPADGLEGIKKFIIETVEIAGGNPCPPILLGIGIGGTMEKAAYLAKKALLRDLNAQNCDPSIAEIEHDLLETINNMGIGPQGLGGKTTALGVNIETYPTHIAGLPVAVNIQCHAIRHGKITL